MAEIGLAVAQTLFAALECAELKHICGIWGYESQLKDLSKTVTTIKKVLQDADSKVLTYEEQEYINELNDALYEADDLFDEFVTHLELDQLETSPDKDDGFFQKVCHFFCSTINHGSLAFQMFQGVTRVQNKLNTIVDNHQKFSLDVDYEPICMRREETCSYVDVNDIIGRDTDKNYIIDKLLESKDQHVQLLTIVGVGGVGKTALAQLVYNDERLKQEFGKAMFWVCVSDQNKKQFNVKDILCKILESVLHQKSFDDACSLDIVQKEIQNHFKGKKYFLVLDDVWNEDREKWVGLKTFLKLGQGGSRVLITTRSGLTATSVGSEWTHMLQGLSLDHSWKLFEMTAFDKRSNQQSLNHIEMVEIGKKIVEKCNNIPLAIKVVGSLLFGQDINTWMSFEKSGLAKIENGDNKIMSVLKLSYYNLKSSLKSCFRYCAVFPKDFEIDKVFLINLWMAQGYIEPLNGGQSVEDAAEEHFKILLRRCFFQDVKKDKYDKIKSVKIHDLMHDVAQEVGGGEFQALSSIDNTLGDKTRHVIVMEVKCFESSSNWSNLRTLLTLDSFRRFSNINEIHKDTNVSNWKSLRVLELKRVNSLNSIGELGKLQHLRYLDLSYSVFEELPNSITKLHNLKMLILYHCIELKQLPQDFRKLVKLNHLNLDGCKKLTDMPLGLNKLKYVGALTNVTGRICVEIGENYRNVEPMDMSGGYLSNISGLKKVTILSKCKEVEANEAALEKLEPHPNLKMLFLKYYKGRTIPWWRRGKDNWTTINQHCNLVHITISHCYNLVSLPSFSKLPFLETLYLRSLHNLEYMETRSSLREATDSTFFPSLVTLDMEEFYEFKGWFREEGLGDADYGSRGGMLPFPCLSTLEIYSCYGLTSFPPCPSIKSINFIRVDKTSELMKKVMGREKEEQEQGGRDLTVGNHTSSSSSSCLVDLQIKWDGELERLSEYEKVFEMCASSLRRLEIEDCYNLRKISRGLEHLTALEKLYLWRNRQLKFSEDDNEEIMAWKPLHKSLRSLRFCKLKNMKSLPKGMQYLTSLQTLQIDRCSKLEGIPEWIGCLSSLQSLTIYRCNAIKSLPEGFQTLTSLQTLKIANCRWLNQTCREPDGQDCKKTQHIPDKELKWYCTFSDSDSE